MKTKVKIGYRFLLPVLLVAVFVSISAQQQVGGAYPVWNPNDLTKESTCKLCHNKDAVGNQWGVWEKGPHAKAFDALKTPRAKEVAAALGIADPSTAGACLRCHSSAYGFTTEPVTKLLAVDDGVGCQTCHGPGDNYKSKTKHAGIRDEAVAKYGMISPTEANTCSRCHNKDNPTYNPERYTTADGRKVDFDFDQAYQKISHPAK